MKNTLALTILLLLGLNCFCQKAAYTAFKWAPSGLILGNLSLYGEYSFGRKSLTAKLGIPVNTRQTLRYDDRDASFRMKATSFLAGYRSYLSRKPMKGLYLEPFFKYVHHSSEGTGRGLMGGHLVTMDFTNEYNGAGFGLQLGVQFLIAKRIVVDVYVPGPELNLARNTLKAHETSSYLPWTNSDANDVEQDMRAFIDKFPFIRKRTALMVDQKHKTVTANFNGLLPGIRAGIAVGFVL